MFEYTFGQKRKSDIFKKRPKRFFPLQNIKTDPFHSSIKNLFLGNNAQLIGGK